MKHGKLSYIEIPALDTLQSADFYAKVFGWNVRGDADHAGFDDPSGDLIGHWVTGRAISRESGVLPYIYVDGIDKTLDEVDREIKDSERRRVKATSGWRRFATPPAISSACGRPGRADRGVPRHQNRAR